MKFVRNPVYITAFKRTAIGKFMGGLADVPAVNLGSIAMKAALIETELTPNGIDEVIIGNMFGGLGQNPARQVALQNYLSYNTVCTTINKACSSGMKSVTLGAESIILGHSNVILAGGIENMSRTPYYFEDYRQGHSYGNTVVKNMLSNDGVYCKHSGLSMGNCSEKTIEKYSISRKEQDEFCAESYRRAANA
jgi:Acetyl-CoA acetyltransferase